MLHPYLSERYQNETPTALGEVTELAGKYDDLLNFSIGDPDLNNDESITRAAFADALAGYTHYTAPRGIPELREEIAKYYEEDFGVKVSDEEVFVSTSASMAMHLVLEAILNDGDEVIVLAPYFTCYDEQIRLARGVTVECETRFEEEFQVNPARLEGCITDRTRAIIVNTPCNPTGNCLSQKSMQELAEIAKRHDLIVIADDIYTIFSYQEPFVPMLSLEGMRERTITINSFSKNFLMTGWRLGSIVAPDYIIRAITHINENVIYSAPSVSQRAGLYALRHRHTLCPPVAEEYRRRLNYAANRINAIPKMRVLTPPGGTFYLFVDIR